MNNFYGEDYPFLFNFYKNCSYAMYYTPSNVHLLFQVESCTKHLAAVVKSVDWAIWPLVNF